MTRSSRVLRLSKNRRNEGCGSRETDSPQTAETRTDEIRGVGGPRNCHRAVLNCRVFKEIIGQEDDSSRRSRTGTNRSLNHRPWIHSRPSSVSRTRSLVTECSEFCGRGTETAMKAMAGATSTDSIPTHRLSSRYDRKPRPLDKTPRRRTKRTLSPLLNG